MYKFGSNTNVPVGSNIYHIQTQVLAEQGMIVTIVVDGGAVVHSEKTPYADFIQGIDDPALRANIVRDSANEQHSGIVAGLERILAEKRKAPSKADEKALIQEFLGVWAAE